MNRDIDRTMDVPKGDEQEILLWLESCFDWGLQARSPYERLALRSFLFWAGNQWATIEDDLVNRFGRRDMRPPMCDSARIVDNQLPIYIRQVISMCTDGLSDYEAMPATPTPADRKAASLATRFLNAREREDKEDEIREAELLWLFGCGEVLRRTWYNTRAKSSEGLPGDLDSEVVNFFRYVKCPSSADAWPPKWLIEFDSRHVDWVKDNYGVEVPPESVADQMQALDALAQNAVTQRSVVSESEDNSVILKRMYTAPSEKYPEGHVWVWAGTKLLRDHPLQAGVFPFSRAFWYEIPGRLYPMSYIEPLISDQRQLNTLLSQLQEVKNRQLRGDVVVHGQGKVTSQVLNAKTKQREIRMDPGIQRWEFLKYDLNLRLAEQDYSRLMRNLHDKAGLAEPTLGQVTNRQTTATELQLLREGGLMNIAYHMRNFDRHICRVNESKLALAREFFVSARSMSDELGTGEEFYFGTDLRNTNRVIAVPTPRMTPAMRRQALLEAIDQGLFGPWRDPDMEGLPSPFLEFAARSKLRHMGLSDIDDQLASDFGSYDELAALVGQLTRMGRQAWLQMAMQRFGMGMGDMAGGMMPPMPGMNTPPIPDNVPAGVVEDMGGATPVPTGMNDPYVPAMSGSTPTDYIVG